MDAERRLCLTGTPLQNNLGDLQSLIKFLRLEPWNQEFMWKNCIERLVQLCDPEGISILQHLMSSISLRRLKTTILKLPAKIEQVVRIPLKSPWDEKYQHLHDMFAEQFGKNRIPGQGWDSAEFFRSLMDLRQL